MGERKTAAHDSVRLDDILPVTPTAGRRHRPSTKGRNIVTASERRAQALLTRSNQRKAKLAIKAKMRVLSEDKREPPDEMVTTAKPKNLGAERDNKKRKGKSTHALETQAPGKRPSRKSTRRGANHVKPDSQQRRRATRAARSPQNRHATASG